jgi:hypothetical protein
VRRCHLGFQLLLRILSRRQRRSTRRPRSASYARHAAHARAQHRRRLRCHSLVRAGGGGHASVAPWRSTEVVSSQAWRWSASREVLRRDSLHAWGASHREARPRRGAGVLDRRRSLRLPQLPRRRLRAQGRSPPRTMATRPTGQRCSGPRWTPSTPWSPGTSCRR